LLTTVISAGASAALLKIPVALCTVGGPAALKQLPAASIAAMGGAYIWGLYEALRRYDSTDLTAAALHMFWVRIVLVAVLGPLVGGLFGEAPAGLLIAFGLGVFPVRTLQNFVISKVDMAAGQPKAEGPTLHIISGVTPPVLERLLDSDVHSVTQLASADPVRLLLRTNLEWRFILDLIDRAKLAVYVGEKVSALRVAGINGAIEMVELHERVLSGDKAVSSAADGAMAYIGGVLGSEAAVKNLILEMHRDPEVRLIRDMWNAVA
jgi:hypothetical protein